MFELVKCSAEYLYFQENLLYEYFFLLKSTPVECLHSYYSSGSSEVLLKITNHKLMPLDKDENGIKKIVDFNNSSYKILTIIIIILRF